MGWRGEESVLKQVLYTSSEEVMYGNQWQLLQLLMPFFFFDPSFFKYLPLFYIFFFGSTYGAGHHNVNKL